MLLSNWLGVWLALSGARPTSGCSGSDPVAAAPAIANDQSSPLTVALSFTSPETLIESLVPIEPWLDWASISPMIARVLRSRLLIATAIPTPVVSPLAIPPTQLMFVSRSPA